MSDWKSVLRAVAPTLATALGGPLAGMAVSAVSNSILGKPDGTDDEITAAISNPDALLKLKEADYAFKTKMAELNVNLEKISQEDRASARQRESATQDPTTKIMAYLYTVAYFGVVWAVWRYGMPPDMKDVLIGLLGILTAAQGTIIGYYFGSSSGSAQKNLLLKG